MAIPMSIRANQPKCQHGLGCYKVPSLSDEPLEIYCCQNNQFSSGAWACLRCCPCSRRCSTPCTHGTTGTRGGPTLSHSTTGTRGGFIRSHTAPRRPSETFSFWGCVAWRIGEELKARVGKETGSKHHMHVCIVKKTFNRETLPRGKQVDFR